jgi:hypothetical protein
MTNEKTPKNAKLYSCVGCDFKCSKQSEYNRHLSTRKHIILTNLNDKTPKTPKVYVCNCGKSYKHASSLCGHKKKCNSHQEQTSKEESQKEDNKDNVIDALIEDNKEMREMFIMFLKNQMESQVTQIENQNNTNKLITGLHENQADMTTKIIREVLPLIGNDHHNTNSHNNTLNFYLTNTCKDAESITDFTSRFCERIETFFNGNYKQIAHNQVNLAENVQEIFFECMDDKTQPNRFIQTTDPKNGIFYVKEQKKNEENKMIGDAEFVKYKDGFDKHGAKIGHAINKVLQPCKNACIPEFKQNVIVNPNEDTDDDDECDHYNNDLSKIKENFMFQTHKAMCIFDNKQVRDKTLSETKRAKLK